ncbi:metallophosphoesterase [Olivibacter sitiensis]|uniref:metallophosphoesterase n=1 Tax=Olivibacter sitiensis TaxID=376470 RepID=UPI000424C465|nr:metallophosphoesterase [Olivibacter sitiensis]
MSVFFVGLFMLLMDAYILGALKSSSQKWVQTKTFSRFWWLYSLLLLLGIYVSIKASIPLSLRAVILVAFFFTFVCKACYMLVLVIDDIRRGGVWLKRRIAPSRKEMDKPPVYEGEAISRAQFINRAGIIVAAVPFATLSYGVALGGYNYEVRRQKLYLPNLPKAFHGLHIGQISDVHSGSFFNKKAVEGGVDLLLAEKPDVIFFTGDLVNSLATEMRNYQDLFARVKAPLGTFSILGNHDYGDYYFGREDSPEKRKNLADLKDVHRILGWDLLLNESRKLTVDNESIGILGSENWGTGRFPKYGDLEQTLKGTEELPVKLLLSHDPSHWRAQVLQYPDIDVMFAGHTHGMQFGVRAEHYQWSPIQYVYHEWAGLYTQLHQQLYVNVGYGFLGYPGRVGVTPEITIFELIRGEAPKG